MRMNTIKKAAEEDRNAILKLYRTRLYGPADWNEYYPSMENIEFDIAHDSLFVMKNRKGEIIAAISIDHDEEVDSLTVWDENIAPAGELARLCVREDMQNQGIAKEMMRYAFDALKEQGKKGVHILVRKGHAGAIACYTTLVFQQVENAVFLKKNSSAWSVNYSNNMT